MPVAPHPAHKAPTDGRVIRGWFQSDHGAEFIAVSWSEHERSWVDLAGERVPLGLRLAAWGDH